MTWRRVRAVGRKEFLHVVRDTRSLLLALLLPFVMLLAFGWGNSNQEIALFPIALIVYTPNSYYTETWAIRRR